MSLSFRQRFNISRFAIHHPWLTINFWIAVSVAGLLAFSSLKYTLFPDVTFPVIIIRASGNFETVVETETNLTSPIENSIITLDSIESVASSTFPNETVITSLFFAGDTLDNAQKTIEKAIKTVKLPTYSKLEIIPYNLNESSAISYVLTSETKTIEDIAEVVKTKIIPPLESLDGILKVNVLGLESPVNKDISPSLIRFNGKEGLGIQIVKRGDGNTLEVVKAVETTMTKLLPSLADMDIKANIAQTEATYIQEATQSTIDTLILAIILAVLIIFPFLANFKATFITALAIPISLFGTFIVMAIGNFNLETITLLALALVIGIVVDDAIVDVENIMRHIEEGDNPKEAAIKGTDEIGLTVTASTLSIVAVFLPIALTTGNLGQFFKPFGLTVSAAVIISLLVARTLSPVLAMLWLRKEKEEDTGREEDKRKGRFSVYYQLFIDRVLQKYRNLLIWSLSHRKIVLVIALVSFILGIILIPFIPQGFIPQLDRGEFNVIYTSELPKIPASWNLNQNAGKDTSVNDNSSFGWLGEIKQNPNGFLLRRSRRVGDEIEASVLQIPEVESTFNIVGFRGQPNRGKIYVKLRKNRKFSTAQVQNKIRENLPVIKGVSVSVEDIKFVDTGDDKPFSFALQGENLTSLFDSATKVKSSLNNLSGLTDLTVSPPLPENTDNILTIEHFNGVRSITFSANIAEGFVLGDLTQEVVNQIQPLLPFDVNIFLGGDYGRMEVVLKQFTIIFILSIVFMLSLLGVLFGSLLEPLVVAFTLPLSIVGAMVALLITQSDFGMISLIGVIFLLGLLDKNALLLIDYAKQQRKKGMARQDAIILTGMTRLRPILMTTFSTILGMLPIALGWGVGAELRQPMAVAIIGGLITSTLLSLIIVPVFYTFIEDFWLKIIKRN
ncbi:efflux RND transporter permease subunit [Geminocystis sp. NIES-3709]|uniref:efflux RND transporter permease subunit n=1 Tax=Geminocystis sp. NIES-3709 TaxID=1617448 RepID=UPI0005FC99A9|nr:efflux RND transporter permease subunit [Geminocystis sp. NIES-3709]BAQ63315.1 cobalt-zinc-cadmium resistance protein CzcA [Geminocystis sp. NIES-3709]